MPAEERRRFGISDGMVRVSIGIEEVADVIADFQEALAAVEAVVPVPA